MDQTSPISAPLARALSPSLRPHLAVVDARFTLVHPAGEIPDEWRQALDALVGWLGIAAEIGPASRPGPLKRLADWSMSGAGERPLFAPWLGWSPATFQHGGLAQLPQAHFAASYLIDHPRGAAPRLGGLDLILMSQHPAQCISDEAGAVPVPRAGVLAAMIRAARAQARKRLAIIVTARQRNAVATRLLTAGKGLTDEGMTLDILTLEEALPILTEPRTPWDAVIAMPDLRSTVFTLLAHASGLCRAWPMLWFADDGALRLVTSEAPGGGLNRLPLDAPALIHTLALTLNAAGAARHAARLHEAWALLRDSGIAIAGQGQVGAPYTSDVSDSAFITMLCRDGAVSKRPQHPWLALKNEENARPGSRNPPLRVISTNENITSG